MGFLVLYKKIKINELEFINILRESKEKIKYTLRTNQYYTFFHLILIIFCYTDMKMERKAIPFINQHIYEND